MNNVNSPAEFLSISAFWTHGNWQYMPDCKMESTSCWGPVSPFYSVRNVMVHRFVCQTPISAVIVLRIFDGEKTLLTKDVGELLIHLGTFNIVDGIAAGRPVKPGLENGIVEYQVRYPTKSPPTNCFGGNLDYELTISCSYTYKELKDMCEIAERLNVPLWDIDNVKLVYKLSQED